jgi:hypothetical protein
MEKLAFNGKRKSGQKRSIRCHMKGLGQTKGTVVVSAKNIKICPSKLRERKYHSGRVFTTKDLFFVQYILTKKFSWAIVPLCHLSVA